MRFSLDRKWKYWNTLQRPMLPFIVKEPTLFRVEGHYLSPWSIGNVMDTIAANPHHQFLLSNDDPDTTLSAPDNCVVMLRANYNDNAVERYLSNGPSLKVLNVYGSITRCPLLSKFDWFLVSGYKIPYVINVVNCVHSMLRPCYVELYNNSRKLPDAINIREFPKIGEEPWLKSIENLFTSPKTGHTQRSKGSTLLTGS